jgi:hypothetical protein
MYTSDRRLRRWVTQGLVALALLSAPVFAQRPPDIKLNAEANRQIVEAVAHG